MLFPFSLQVEAGQANPRDSRWKHFVRAARLHGVWVNREEYSGDRGHLEIAMRDVACVRRDSPQLDGEVAAVTYAEWEDSPLGQTRQVSRVCGTQVFRMPWRLADMIVVVDRHARMKGSEGAWQQLAGLPRRHPHGEVPVLVVSHLREFDPALPGLEFCPMSTEHSRRFNRYFRLHDRFMLFRLPAACEGRSVWWAMTVGQGVQSITASHPTFAALVPPDEVLCELTWERGGKDESKWGAVLADECDAARARRRPNSLV